MKATILPFQDQKKPRGRPGLGVENRARILDAANAMMRDHGGRGLTARKLAARAGIATGSLYKFYPDMDAIIGAVKLQTYRELTLHLRQAMEDHSRLRPLDRLMQLAWAYLDFVSSHGALWSAILEFERGNRGRDEAFIRAEDALFGIIELELNSLPRLSRKQSPALARALWASVHGIVAQTLPNSLQSDPVGDTLSQIEMIIGAVVRDYT